jgi:hypothetical protein
LLLEFCILLLTPDSWLRLLESPRAGERLDFNPRIGRAGISRGEAPWLGFICTCVLVACFSLILSVIFRRGVELEKEHSLTV